MPLLVPRTCPPTPGILEACLVVSAIIYLQLYKCERVNVIVLIFYLVNALAVMTPPRLTQNFKMYDLKILITQDLPAGSGEH